jgi:hypothetical protein
VGCRGSRSESNEGNLAMKTKQWTWMRLLVVTSFACFSSAAIGAESIDAKVEGNRISIKVASGATVALFGVTRAWDGHAPVVTKHGRVLVDEDRDGLVLHDVEGASGTAVWIAADLASGSHTVFAPGTWSLQQKPIPASAFVSRGQGRNGVVTDERELFAVVIRPGVGAWEGTLTDGSSRDDDGIVDGRVTLSLSGLKQLGTGTPSNTPSLQKDDVVIYISPLTLAVRDGRVVR